ncbi:hypothetical protein MMC11_007045 [Xylographa trunciseda]|nr:hypothetical protein [Xylographa trunciseda]
MDPFSITVGVLGIIDLCLRFKPDNRFDRYGKVLIKTYSDYQNAETEVAETLLKLKVLWYKTESQMDLLTKVWDSLDPILQQNQHLLLCQLEVKLQKAIGLINAIVHGKQTATSLADILRIKGKVKRERYALSVKESLDRSVADFSEWHYLFDPSWYLIAQVASDEIDRYLRNKKNDDNSPVQGLIALRKSIRDLNVPSNRPVREISSHDFLGPRSLIPESSAAMADFQDRNSYAVVDSMIPNQFADETATIRDVTALCKALSRMDPQVFGLLRCCGVINKSLETDVENLTIEKLPTTNRQLAYDLAFEVPLGLSKPKSLRDLLKHQQASLNLRLDISRQLAMSVFYLHITGFVHKNLRPENILVFEQEASMSKVPCLVGFEKFRLADSSTFLVGDSLKEREIYRHPSRQGNDPEQKYVMQHDIYSLGVCLLEIGLWKSFVQQSEFQGGFLPLAELEIDELLVESNNRKSALGIKKRMMVVAEEQLPMHMGDKLTQVVSKCLGCLDDTEFWNESDDEGSEDVNIGVQFIENVLLQLQEIVI